MSSQILISSIIAAGSSFLITFLIIPFCMMLAQKLDFFDVPDGVVKLHKKRVPYFGGLAVVSGFFCGLIATNTLHTLPCLLLIGMLFLFGIGLLDDIFVLRPWQKFLGQLISGACFIAAGLYLKTDFFNLWWRIPVSVLWMATLMNACNLVDIMDGLATCITLGALGSFAAIAVALSHYWLLPILAALSGSLCAFLWYNKPPAQIYLGDAGSLFLGSFLGVCPFLLPWGTYTIYGALAPCIILAVLLLEVGGLIIVRTYKRIPFYLPSADHFKSYLMAQGWSVKKIIFFTLFLSAITGYVSLLFVQGVFSLAITGVMGSVYLAIWILTIYLS